MNRKLIAVASAAMIGLTAVAIPKQVEAGSNDWWIPGAIIGGLALGAFGPDYYGYGYGPYYPSYGYGAGYGSGEYISGRYHRPYRNMYGQRYDYQRPYRYDRPYKHWTEF